MKKENWLIRILFMILIILVMIIFIKNYINDSKVYKNNRIPFTNLEILNKEITLIDNKRSYEITRDCQNIVDENAQLINYQLDEDFEMATIDINTKFFKNNIYLEANFNEATSFETIITVSNNNAYEQLYYIKGLCRVN